MWTCRKKRRSVPAGRCDSRVEVQEETPNSGGQAPRLADDR
jgi:hypothetical protein